MKLSKKGKKVLLIGLIIIVLVILVIINLLNNKEFKVNFESRVETLQQFKTKARRIGWIQVQGTNIDLPILASTDYLSSDDDYKYSWLSGNYVDGENRKVIVGHNVLNVSSHPIRDMSNLEDFEGLMAFVYHDFAEDNLYIQYTDFKTGEDKLFLIYAIGFYDYVYDRGESLSSKPEIEEYIETTKNNSIYDYDIDVNSNDTLITIKTCTRYFGLDGKQQFVIDAREIREDEEISKYDVKKSKVFEELGL